MDFSKLILPFSVLIIAVLIAAGGIFLLSQFSTPPPTPPPTPSPTPQAQETLNAAVLSNLEYYHSYCEVPMKLTDGVFQWIDDFPCNQEPTFGFFFQIYNGKIAIGDLNSDTKNDAAVVLTTNYGGSGNFRELAVVMNQNGVFKHVVSTDLGDRVIVNEISIQDDRILLDMVVHGLDDGACCPTQPAQKIFQFDVVKNKIIEVESLIGGVDEANIVELVKDLPDIALLQSITLNQNIELRVVERPQKENTYFVVEVWENLTGEPALFQRYRYNVSTNELMIDLPLNPSEFDIFTRSVLDKETGEIVALMNGDTREDCATGTQLVLNFCGGRTADLADEVLGVVYQRILGDSTISQEAKNDLVEEERAWIQEKEEECAPQLTESGQYDGSIQPLLMARCEESMARERIGMLLDTYLRSDWVTYRSEELGIEFEYPRSFHESDACRIKELDDGMRLSFSSLWQVETRNVVGNQDFEPFLEKFIGERQEEDYITSIISEERIQVDRHSSLIIDHYTDRHFSGSGSPDKRGKFALIENGENALFVSFINGITKCGASVPGDPFDHLISTLRFLR